MSLGASCSQKQRPPLRRSRSQKQRLPPRRQVAWRRDRKRFSYCLVCISSAISIPSSRFHSFPCIFIHFHISSIFHFHFHFYFQYTPRSDINQSMRSLILHSQKKSAQLRVISREETDFVKGCEISVDFLRVLQSSISTFPSSSPNIECQFHQTSNSSISFVSKRGVCIT